MCSALAGVRGGGRDPGQENLPRTTSVNFKGREHCLLRPPGGQGQANGELVSTHAVRQESSGASDETGLGGNQDGRGVCTAGSQSLGVVVSAPEGGEVRLWPLRDQRETSQWAERKEPVLWRGGRLAGTLPPPSRISPPARESGQSNAETALHG